MTTRRKLPDRPVTMWRCAWREGSIEMTRDFRKESEAERHANWLRRRDERCTPHVYRIRVYVERKAS